MDYQLSAGAILCSLLRLGKSGIYGVENQLAALEEGEFPAFMRRAEGELLKKGLAKMNFSGEFTLKKELAELIGRCADAASVLTAGRRLNLEEQSVTCYFPGDGSFPCLRRLSSDDYRLSESVQPAEAILSLLALPQGSESLTEALADTALAAKHDKALLEQAGCPADTAEVLTEAASGSGGYAVITRIKDRAVTDQCCLFYSEKGCLLVTTEYTESQELLRLQPITAAEVGRRIEQMV